jgi:flagellar basal-body rod protein FlgC
MTDLMDTMKISASGMKAQSDRLKIISQNVANADSVGSRNGTQPYRRQTIAFKDALDRETGTNMVKVDKIGVDRSDFKEKYEPNHPMADERGYVLYPNVNSIMEMMDMREARRGYEANLNVIESSKSMLNQTIGLLR